ncbi:MAG: hypothetical protein ACRDTR_04815 [Rubrobacter sp.]
MGPGQSRILAQPATIAGTQQEWHLASRLLRKALSHTVAFLLNHQLLLGNPPLQPSKLLV